jgi:hypothetical protein
MGETTHTPGPWDVMEGRTLFHVETAINHPVEAGRAICSVPKGALGAPNARLISAALFIWHGAIGSAWPRYAGSPYDIAVVAAGAVLLVLAVGAAIVAVIRDLGNGD